jgi:hypothetical protein
MYKLLIYGTCYCVNHLSSFVGKEGSVLVRSFPCFCQACMEEKYPHCAEKGYAGTFSAQIMRKKALRTPTARFHESDRVVVEANTQYIVKAIKGNRFFEGRYQYEIEWDGFTDTNWVDADKLSCIDLMEEYEIDNS